MTRVKIKFPDEKPLYTAIIPVRIGDINYGNHVGNDAILSIIHESRMQMVSEWGFTELDAGGNGFLMADVMISYKAEGFYGDILTVKIFIDELTDRSFNLLYHIGTQRGAKELEIAHAKTGMVCFDYKEKKIALMTELFKKKLTGQ